MRRCTGLFAVILGLSVAVLASSGREPEKGKENELMRRKLACSQKVLEGIAVADYKMIGKNAEELLQISKEAGFRVLKTPTYELHTNQFRRSVEALIQNAKEKNIDAAALTYVDLTLTCVKCHKHVRDERMTSRD
jgi:hypothetical protein